MCDGGGQIQPQLTDGYDWRVPAWVEQKPAASGGIYSKRRYMDATNSTNISAVVVDVSWRQISPGPGQIDLNAVGVFSPTAESPPREYASWNGQTQGELRYWVRFFTSHRDWMPQWVIDECNVSNIRADIPHMPIWNPCVWGHLQDTYAAFATEAGLLNNERFVMMYVPGGFEWAEYALSVVEKAALWVISPRPNTNSGSERW